MWLAVKSFRDGQNATDVTEDTKATTPRIRSVAVDPTYGMKLKNPAITPHRTGFGMPNVHMAVDVATPRPRFIRAIVA
jgi:hypothetical protein